jgi:hypothetical protein
MGATLSNAEGCDLKRGARRVFRWPGFKFPVGVLLRFQSIFSRRYTNNWTNEMGVDGGVLLPQAIIQVLSSLLFADEEMEPGESGGLYRGQLRLLESGAAGYAPPNHVAKIEVFVGTTISVARGVLRMEKLGLTDAPRRQQGIFIAGLLALAVALAGALYFLVQLDLPAVLAIVVGFLVAAVAIGRFYLVVTQELF